MAGRPSGRAADRTENKAAAITSARRRIALLNIVTHSHSADAAATRAAPPVPAQASTITVGVSRSAEQRRKTSIFQQS